MVVDHILVAAVARNTPFSLLFDSQSENPHNEPNRLDLLPVRLYSMGSRFAIYFHFQNWSTSSKYEKSH